MARGKSWLTAGFNPKAAVAELMAATLFIYIGCGTATTFSAQRSNNDFQLESTTNRAEGDIGANIRELSNNVATTGSWGITTALAFGLAITVLAYATAHLSGGQINPAVTLSLLLSNNLGLLQAVANMAAQVAGAILGAGLLYATIPDSSMSTLASNQLSPGVGVGNALCGEIVMTFVLCSVVLEVTTNKNEAARAQAPLAIGFAVFCAHAVMLPIDGCSINPARSLGPAIVSSTWPSTFWVFVVGPFLGAIASVPLHLFFASKLFTGKSGQSYDPLALSGSSGKSTPGGGGGSAPTHQGPGGVASGGGDSAAPTPRYHAASVV